MHKIYLVKEWHGVNAYPTLADATNKANRLGCWPNYYSNCPNICYKYVTLNCNKYKIEWVK